MMLLNKYLAVVFGLVAFDSIFYTVAYSMLLDLNLAQLILGARMLVDIAFLAFAWRDIKLTRIEVTLILMVLFSSLCATLPSSQYSSAYSISRFFNDLSGPLLFILKVSVLRSLFRQVNSEFDIKKLSKALMYLSVVQILIFLYFSLGSGAYAGITPPINIPAAWYIGTYNYLGLAAAVVVVVLSGKRSFLVSVAIVSAFAIVVRGSFRNKLAFVMLLVSLITLYVLFGNEKINNTIISANVLLDLMGGGYIDFGSEQIRSGLYLLTAGRSAEFYGIINEMESWSWLVGLGPGFTYTVFHVDGLIEGHANAHFTPLSLTYKFGLPFTLMFYAYLAGVIRALLNISHPRSFIVGCALSIFFLQSFFAFNFFPEPYFAILLSLGMSIISIAKRMESRSLYI